MSQKPWFKSKTVWSDIITIGVALYGSIGSVLGPDIGIHLNPIPAAFLTFLGALGLYGRVTATSQIDTGAV